MKRAELRRASGKNFEEGEGDIDEQEPWMENTIKPYGTYVKKKTQFFTNADAFDVFEALLAELKKDGVAHEISSASLKVKLDVN